MGCERKRMVVTARPADIYLISNRKGRNLPLCKKYVAAKNSFCELPLISFHCPSAVQVALLYASKSS